MEWNKKIEKGMALISSGCEENRSFTTCNICPFNSYCDAIQIGAESGLDIDIPENWEYEE